MSQLDDFLLKEYSSVSPRFCVDRVFDGEIAFDLWKAGIREEIKGKLAFDGQCPVPKSETIGNEEKDGYLISHIEFMIPSGLTCPLFLLVPDNPKGLVLALHGHGYGVLDIIGGIEEETYQKKFALELCRKGFAVAAPELIGFGSMRLQADIDSGNPKQSSCHRLSMNLLSEGKTLLGLRVEEASAALSLAKSLFPGLKTGAMGISGGGTVAAFLSALRDDISAAVISGYANCFRTSILAMSHCVCNYLPGMLRSFELTDVLSAIAPTPMLWESGISDPIYPNEAAKEAERTVRKCYSMMDMSNRFMCDYFEGVHEIHGEQAYRFLIDMLC